jgi:hypothetical protein
VVRNNGQRVPGSLAETQPRASLVRAEAASDRNHPTTLHSSEEGGTGQEHRASRLVAENLGRRRFRPMGEFVQDGEPGSVDLKAGPQIDPPLTADANQASLIPESPLWGLT